ncbi:S9 family peptidase [Flavobacterium psychrotrophum]|uniref:S9 family peptidase n=1 Tax=Flavobacterium psychrotrophum TaxID=2294119 RepID=UPI000E310431|nr:S9 family peptidase [Flavobacterium psychrotrophum]
MKKLHLPLMGLAVLFMASCLKDNKQEARTPKQFTIEELFDTKSISGEGFSTDESKILVSNNTTGIFNAYELIIADSSQTALTNSVKESVFAIDYLPGSNNFIYTSDEGGNENNHIFLMDRKTKKAKDLTPWANSKSGFNGWSIDKKSLYISSNKRDPKYFDLWKMDTLSWTPVLIYQNNDGMTPGALSDNEQYITLSQEVTTDKSELFIYDTKTKASKRISDGTDSNWNASTFEKDNSALYYTTNSTSEFSVLYKYEIATGKSTKVYEDKWDVAGMSLSENGKYHTIFINDDGKNKVLLFDHASGKAVDMPVIEDGDILGVTISKSETKLLLTVGSSTSPANLYVYDIATKNLKRLTTTLNKKVDEADLVKAEVIRFKSFDGKEIPAIYYKPLQASPDAKVPALVWVHGGPGGQSRIGYSNSIQYFVNRGYAVLAVNNRGSSGYGKTFYKLDNKDHSNGDLKDCIWAKKWLAGQDYIDANAVGIYGGSYGGCMVLGAMAFHPEEFKVGVDLFGVANWPRTLKSIPPYWESFRKALYDEMGDPFTKDSIRLKNISPLYNYQKINKPLIVLQGMNDVRVLPLESQEIVEGVKKNGVPVEYVTFDDEGHGFMKKENQITAAKKTLAFLDKYLKTKATEKK